MVAQSVTSQRGAQTRDALIAAAIDVFASEGFHAVSTRKIARNAGVNLALISYHFGNKEGLYIAVFRFITEQINERMSPVVATIEAALADGSDDSNRVGRSAESLAMLQRLTDGMTDLVLKEASSPWAQLILREQHAPTEAFNVFYDGVMGPMLNLFTRLIKRAMACDDARAKLIAVTIVGQVTMWRTYQGGVVRHLGWSRIGPRQIAAIKSQVRENVAALLGMRVAL